MVTLLSIALFCCLANHTIYATFCYQMYNKWLLGTAYTVSNTEKAISCCITTYIYYILHDEYTLAKKKRKPIFTEQTEPYVKNKNTIKTERFYSEDVSFCNAGKCQIFKMRSG